MVVKKVEDTGKVDKDGKSVKVTKYEPKAGVVVFNEEANVYEIHTEEPEVEDVAPETVDDTEKAPERELPAGAVSAEEIGEAYLEDKINNRLNNN